MAKIGKYFRLSEQAVQILENRDRNKYPYEVDLIEAGLCMLDDERSSVNLENILKEIRELKETVSDMQRFMTKVDEREDYPLPKL